jgi:predicted ABC-type ATPase
VVRRRYERGRINLTQLYLPLCDTWIIYDNSRETPSLVAERPLAQQTMIYSPSIWQQITEVAHD